MRDRDGGRRGELSGWRRSIIRRISSRWEPARVLQFLPVDVISRVSASPTQPIMIEDGNGQGCDIA
jgi:hypothetical protein